jgi:hypothetical protein
MKDGSFGCSLPCVDCRRAIAEVGLHIHAFVGGSWVTYEDTNSMPPSKMSVTALKRKLDRSCIHGGGVAPPHVA